MREDIENVSLKQIRDFIELQYRKPSDIISVSRNKPFNKLDWFGDVNFTSENPCPTIMIGDYANPIEKTNKHENTSIINSMDVHSDFDVMKFLTYMLADGLQSPMMKEIREKRGLTATWCWNWCR